MSKKGKVPRRQGRAPIPSEPLSRNRDAERDCLELLDALQMAAETGNYNGKIMNSGQEVVRAYAMMKGRVESAFFNTLRLGGYMERYQELDRKIRTRPPVEEKVPILDDLVVSERAFKAAIRVVLEKVATGLSLEEAVEIVASLVKLDPERLMTYCRGHDLTRRGFSQKGVEEKVRVPQEPEGNLEPWMTDPTLYKRVIDTLRPDEFIKDAAIRVANERGIGNAEAFALYCRTKRRREWNKPITSESGERSREIATGEPTGGQPKTEGQPETPTLGKAIQAQGSSLVVVLGKEDLKACLALHQEFQRTNKVRETLNKVAGDKFLTSTYLAMQYRLFLEFLEKEIDKPRTSGTSLEEVFAQSACKLGLPESYLVNFSSNREKYSELMTILRKIVSEGETSVGSEEGIKQVSLDGDTPAGKIPLGNLERTFPILETTGRRNQGRATAPKRSRLLRLDSAREKVYDLVHGPEKIPVKTACARVAPEYGTSGHSLAVSYYKHLTEIEARRVASGASISPSAVASPDNDGEERKDPQEAPVQRTSRKKGSELSKVREETTVAKEPKRGPSKLDPLLEEVYDLINQPGKLVSAVQACKEVISHHPVLTTLASLQGEYSRKKGKIAEARAAQAKAAAPDQATPPVTDEVVETPREEAAALAEVVQIPVEVGGNGAVGSPEVVAPEAVGIEVGGNGSVPEELVRSCPVEVVPPQDAFQALVAAGEDLRKFAVLAVRVAGDVRTAESEVTRLEKELSEARKLLEKKKTQATKINGVLAGIRSSVSDILEEADV